MVAIRWCPPRCADSCSRRPQRRATPMASRHPSLLRLCMVSCGCNHCSITCRPCTHPNVAWLCVCLLVVGTITTLTARWANQRDAEREGAKNKAKALASATAGAGAGSGGGGGGGLGSGGEGGRKRGMRGAVLAAAMTQMSRRPPVTARDAGHSSSSKEKSLPSIKS